MAPSKVHRSAHRLAWLFAAALLALAGCQGDGGQQQGGADAMPPPEVDVVVLETRPLEVSETYAGRVVAYRVAEIRPQVSGIILKRHFREGSQVAAGDLLYQIDPALFEAALASAESELAEAQANAHAARLLAERYARLVGTSAVSKHDADDADAAWKQAQAAVQSAEAAVRSARINLQYTCITAPIPGIIGRSSITEGALVSAQQDTPLATVRQLSPVYVDIRQPAATLLRLKRDSGTPDAPVTLTLEDGTPFAETGRLQFAEQEVDPGTGTVTLRTHFDNRERLLLPGMFVRARMVIERLDGALLAPQQGIMRQPNGTAMALVVNDDNQVERRAVTLGRAIGDDWLVSAGLSAGDRLIVSGLQKVQPGASVTVRQRSDAGAAH